ncbi:hypothetical protein [Escherichia coli]|uniref:hypothetical protein n=1 Tax=Escherichia coli TaxID=562 RepID=UPI0030F3BD91
MNNKAVFTGIDARIGTPENNPFTGKGATNMVASSGYVPMFRAGITQELNKLAPAKFAVAMPDNQGNLEAVYFSSREAAKTFCYKYNFPAFFELCQGGASRDLAWLSCGNKQPGEFNFCGRMESFDQHVTLAQMESLLGAENSTLKSAMIDASLAFTRKPGNGDAPGESYSWLI